MSSANAFNLDQSKNMLFGKELRALKGFKYQRGRDYKNNSSPLVHHDQVQGV